MPPIIINCPQCACQLRVPDTMTPGTKVKCPKCSMMFETPQGDAPPPPPRYPAPAPPGPGYAPDEPLPEYGPGDTGPHYHRRGGWEPDDAGLEGGYRPPRGIDDLAPDYAIDINDMFNRAQNHWGNVMGAMIGYMLVIFAISFGAGLIPFVGGLIFQVVLAPALEAGFVIVALLELRGRYWSFNDFWSGFTYLVPLMVVRLLTLLTGAACLGPGIIMAIALNANRNEDLLPIAFGLTFIGFLVFVYLAVRAFVFVVPLIVDRQCGPIEAIQGSWRLTEGHFWGWLGVAILQNLIMLAGVLMLCIGVLFTFPFAVLLMAAGYMQVAGGRRQAMESSPL